MSVPALISRDFLILFVLTNIIFYGTVFIFWIVNIIMDYPMPLPDVYLSSTAAESSAYYSYRLDNNTKESVEVVLTRTSHGVSSTLVFDLFPGTVTYEGADLAGTTISLSAVLKGGQPCLTRNITLPADVGMTNRAVSRPRKHFSIRSRTSYNGTKHCVIETGTAFAMIFSD